MKAAVDLVAERGAGGMVEMFHAACPNYGKQAEAREGLSVDSREVTSCSRALGVLCCGSSTFRGMRRFVFFRPPPRACTCI